MDCGNRVQFEMVSDDCAKIDPKDAKYCFQCGGKIQINYSLKRLRDKRALSLKDLELICGVHRTTIYRLENGRQKASARTIRKLARAFQVEPEELLS